MSDKILNKAFIALILLTGLTALLSPFSIDGSTAVLTGIMFLAVVKVFIVAFQFMELKYAHNAWKVALWLLILTIAACIVLLAP